MILIINIIIKHQLELFNKFNFNFGSERKQKYKMSYEAWLNYIRNAEKSSFISGKIRKVHYRMTDGTEMSEEYSMDTGILMRRAWKKKNDVLCMQPEENDVNSVMFNWDIELGEIVKPTIENEFMVKESNTAVSHHNYNFFFHKTKISFL